MENNKNNEEEITKDNYKPKLFKRMIILCWVVLGLCFIVKLFGGNFFNIVCQDERFIKFCNYIQNSFWYYIVSFVFYCLNTILIWLAMFRCLMFNKKSLFIAIIIIAIIYCLQVLCQIYFNSLLVSFVFTILRYIIIPICLFKFKIKNVIIISILDVCTQFITIIIKDLSIIKVLDENVLISLIFMIDYYIMTILIYLYSYYTKKNKEIKIMGLFGGWWLHKPLAELEALLPTLTDEKEINACKKRIEKLKAKNEKKKTD